MRALIVRIRKSSMQRCEHISSRIRSGVVAGGAAILTLLTMSLNIGGLDNILPIIRNFGLLFSGASILAIALGLFLYRRRLRWSIAVGVATGLTCGFIIVLLVVSSI